MKQPNFGVMRWNARVTHFGTLVSACVFLAACIYVPPVWDVGDEIGSVDWIEEGVSTKAQVLDTMGQPHAEMPKGSHSLSEGSAVGYTAKLAPASFASVEAIEPIVAC